MQCNKKKKKPTAGSGMQHGSLAATWNPYILYWSAWLKNWLPVTQLGKGAGFFCCFQVQLLVGEETHTLLRQGTQKPAFSLL